MAAVSFGTACGDKVSSMGLSMTEKCSFPSPQRHTRILSGIWSSESHTSHSAGQKDKDTMRFPPCTHNSHCCVSPHISFPRGKLMITAAKSTTIIMAIQEWVDHSLAMAKTFINVDYVTSALITHKPQMTQSCVLSFPEWKFCWLNMFWLTAIFFFSLILDIH